MLEILGFILITILWIIVGTSYLKINPIITLLIAALLLSFLIGIPFNEVHLVIGSVRGYRRESKIIISENLIR